MSAPEAAKLTYDEICGGKSLTFTPPAALTIDSGSGVTQTVSVYTNSSVNKGTQGSSRYCEGGGFYAREDVRYGATSFMLNFGTGGSIKTSPEGLWKLVYGGSEVARFDFITASPVKDDKPTVWVMSPKFNTSGGNIVSAQVEFYRWDGSAYAKITDLAPVKALVGEINCSVTRTSDNGESRVDLDIGSDGTIMGMFDGSSVHGDEIVNPAVTLSDAKALACYYTIGDTNYRVEVR